MKKLASILLAVGLILSVTATALGAGEAADLVTDAVTDSIETGWGVYEYHIPAVTLPGADMSALNAEIYDALYPELEASLAEMAQYGYVLTSGGISYSWTVRGDILSLLISNYEDPEASGGDVYTVYNISVATGEPVSDEAVLAQCGFSAGAFRPAAEQAIIAGQYEVVGRYAAAVGQDMASDCMTRSLSAENLAGASLFIHANGHLCMACGMYMLAAAGYYNYLFDLVEGTLFTYETWTPENTGGAAPGDPIQAAAEDPGLVTDAYAYQLPSEQGTRYFQVPQIHWEGDGIQAVNDQIWRDVYEPYLAPAAEGADGTEPIHVQGLHYTWAADGGILSLCVSVELMENDLVDYYVYNVSLTEGRQLTGQELLNALSVDEDEFYARVRRGLDSAYQALYPSWPDDTFRAQQLDRTLAEENLRLAVPYLAPGGQLCVIGRFYSLAGAEFYDYPVALPDSADASDPVVYFIEHSDSQYFTENDIEGFTKQMCLYARNGVYARSGRGFQSQELLDYFLQFDWYSPAIAPDQFTDDYLNDYQTQNIALVLAYEQAHGYM